MSIRSIPKTVTPHKLGQAVKSGKRADKMWIKDDLGHFGVSSSIRADAVAYLTEFYLGTGMDVEVFDFDLVADADIYCSEPGVLTVSLDKNIPAHAYLGMSRVFESGGYQDKPVDTLIHHDFDFSTLSGKTVMLTDDDSLSGWNLHHAKSYLEEFGITVLDYAKTVFDLGSMEDIVDVSDFTGLPGSGLVVRESDGTTHRVPYSNAHGVNPVTRSSCPPSMTSEYAAMSQNILELF